MEEVFKLTSSLPYEELLEYFNNPKNIMTYIPLFKEIDKIDNNSYIVKIGWIFNINLKVFKISMKNRITYIVEHNAFPKISGKLDHIFEPRQGKPNVTEIDITFYYNGPFEKIAKLQSRKLYESIKKKFLNEETSEEENKKDVFTEEKASMKTILSGSIDMQNIDSLISKAIVESNKCEIELIIGEGDSSAKLFFVDGNLVMQTGSLNNLKGRNKFLLRKKE
ncbi:hypothetical protein DFR86_02320 [Acidianus sulfidivorans JP7]|uniref:Uncharacterized protein n=1 Tax=Acidianus sulfidivorans JP7 TaxID=619593 RepID=A0A2U9IKC6_9CREN|nr:hypothetical protein [Acidianus sulfidivorans]AWR96502.1 hypothetical protein DFR86_02320 [Acidianus sulfidivorans JP7]